MNIPTSVYLLAFAAFLLWLATPPKKRNPRDPKRKFAVFDTSGYYILEGEPGKRTLAHWQKFEFCSHARDFIPTLDASHFKKLHVGYWNGKEWLCFYDA